MGVKVKNWRGAYWVFVNSGGKRKAKRVGEGKAGKRAAELVATKIQAKLADGDRSVFAPDPAASPTLRAYAEHWLRSEAALRLKPITIERYTSVIQRHLVPAFGEVQLRDLTRTAVKGQLAVWLKSGKVRGSGPLRPGSASC
jgi:integrase